MENIFFPKTYDKKNVKIDMFFKESLDRVYILKEVDRFLIKKSHLTDSEQTEYMRKIDLLLVSPVLLGWRSQISQLVLKEAYKKDQEAFKWFAKLETFLFKLRLQENNSEQKEIILSKYEHFLGAIYEKEKNVYLVPFEKCVKLLQSGSVILRNGNALLSKEQTLSLIVNLFEDSIYEGEHKASFPKHFFPKLQFLFKKLLALNPKSNQYQIMKINRDTDSKSLENVRDIEDLSELAKNAFPLCMQLAYNTLKQVGHLKHGGRMMFSLFLKDAGLPLENALVLWEKAFAKTTTHDEFEKAYSYNLKHNYGKEGKKTNYTSYGCSKLISVMPNVGDIYGCPFKLLNNTDLKKILKKTIVNQENSEKNINEILDFKNKMQYQLACGKYFDLKNGIHSEEIFGVNSPIEYFNDMVEFIRKNKNF